MGLAAADRTLIVDELGREPTREEAALFENLWSEHCAYRSSRPLLSAFDGGGADVIIGPGDDAAVVSITDDLAITLGIESHNHPSYVDPFDGAATGVGGIVRDTMSMGAYPIALCDCLHFGEFGSEHARYLFEGVVEGISHYGNCIGVPTVAGSVDFHPGYQGNPLVNVGCVGLVEPDRVVTAEAQEPGNKLVLVGNATGRDGLGGASFASEDLSENAETEDRPAVQVGDPYTEKLLIEANEALLDAGVIKSARDLGAAGLGGATSEMVAKGGLGARINLGAVHQREPGMNALEILLAESQERMAYEVAPENVEQVREIAERFDLGCSVIGVVTTDAYTCTFEGETVVDVDAAFLGDGAPMNDLPAAESEKPEQALPDANIKKAFEAVLSSPNTASKEWVYRQYDHEVGARTAVRPGDDAAVLALQDGEIGLGISGGSDPRWTSAAPFAGARAIALENAANLATKGVTPIAAVDCLNGGNPENPDVYGGFTHIVEGLAEMCRTLDVPVVGGNVSLYNDSEAGPIPPTPTLLMVGKREGVDTPPAALSEKGTIVLVGDPDGRLGGSEYLEQTGGSDRFPSLPETPATRIRAFADIATDDATLATHDVSNGGIGVALAEMITDETGATVEIPGERSPAERLFCERPGRAIVQTTDPDGVRGRFEGIAPVREIGSPAPGGNLRIAIDDRKLKHMAATLRERRDVIERELG